MQLDKRLASAATVMLVAGGSFVLGHSVDLGNFDSAYAQGTQNSVRIAATPAEIAARTLSGNSIADVAEKVAPAVVLIEVDQLVAANPMAGMPLPFANIPGFGNMEFFFNGQKVTPGQGQAAPGGKSMPPKMEKRNTGSGVVIRPDGYIITNAHVVRGADKIKVHMNDGKIVPGKVVGVDNFSDVAVVKIDGTNLPTAQMGTSTGLRPGDFAIAIGNPLGLDHTVTLGIISAVKRQVTDVNGNINFIQTDAAINPGNSGGPLLNLNGDIIGINTAMQANGQNIGFSIPIDIAKDVAENLIANKKILRPWLGIAMQEMDETMAKSLGLPITTKGVVIGQVLDTSPAAAAGLETGDVIQKIDGNNMETPRQVQEFVRSHKVSDVLNFFVLRKNAPRAVAVNIGQYPDKLASGDDHAAPAKPSQPTNPRQQGSGEDE
jgi:serine protease Do